MSEETAVRDPELEQRCINVIRGLAMDAPQAAKSGHPGTAMALAPLAHVLWTRVMRYEASEPDWPNRDRFILSAGHASILLYSMLYLTGYGLTLADIKAFRQWGSHTPGHPEVHHTKGVEVTTGPLGQGLGNSAGMAIAEHALRGRFGSQLFDHHTFVIASDGDLEEGLSHEAASLAGHLGLGKLVVVYDDNHISIDGPTELAFTDDTPKRFEAYGWHVDRAGEIANDLDALEAAVRSAMVREDQPSLIVLRSHIGYPSPEYTDTAHAHGNPLGDEEVRATKAILGCHRTRPFTPPKTLSRSTARPAAVVGWIASIGNRPGRTGPTIGPPSKPASRVAVSRAGRPSCRRGRWARRSRPATRARHVSTPSWMSSRR